MTSLRLRRKALVPSAVAAFLGLLACSKDEDGTGAGGGAASAAAATTTDGAARTAAAPAVDWRKELLDVSFDAVSAMPLRPHLKNRSRGQYRVVNCALQAGFPELAASYATRIDNWRRGLGQADVAFHLVQTLPDDLDAAARKERLRRAESLLRSAAARAEQAREVEKELDWRPDRIEARIAGARYLLGEKDAAEKAMQGLEPSEVGLLARSRAEGFTREEVLAQFDELDAVLEGQDFDATRAAFGACVVFYRRFFADAELRAALEQRLERDFDRIDPTVRIDLWLDLGAVAAAHGDTDAGAEWVDRARAAFDRGTWRPETSIPVFARIAKVRQSLGDTDAARELLETALVLYDESLRIVQSFLRAGLLRPVAEAYVETGDLDKASQVYSRALEDGAVNPNARCRADDLQGTCCSMVLSGFEPTDRQLERIREILAQLGDPW